MQCRHVFLGFCGRLAELLFVTRLVDRAAVWVALFLILSTTARYKCNRVTNAIAFNSLDLLQKIVPKILKCRTFRGIESEREGAGLVCGEDQNESTRTPQIMALELSLKKIGRDTKLQESLRHDADKFNKQHRAERKEMASWCFACSRT